MGCACITIDDCPRNVNKYKTKNFNNHNFLSSNISNLKKEKLVTCIINKDNKKFNEKINSMNKIKDLKTNIIKNYYKTDNKNIKLYYKGKLIQDNKKINEIITENENELNNSNVLNLSMISFSISEISVKDKEENSEKIMNLSDLNIDLNKGIKVEKINNINKEVNYFEKDIERLSSFYDTKNNIFQKQFFICINCQIFLSKNKIDEHINIFKDHEIISKNDLIKLNDEINDIKKEINLKLINLGIKKENKLNDFDTNNEIDNDYIKLSEVLKDIKKKIINSENITYRFIDNLKRKHKEIINKYELNIQKFISSILEFNEKVNNIIYEMNHEKTFINEENFISTYKKLINLKKLKEKYLNSIKQLKYELKGYKNNLKKIKKNTEKLSQLFSTQYNNIINNESSSDLTEDSIINLKSTFKNNNTNDKSIKIDNINYKSLNENPKLNLMTILSTSNNKKDLKESIEFSLKNKKYNLEEVKEENNFEK